MRIGIYSGSFNPVHGGHIAFALQALETGALDRVYFLPERRPGAASTVEHFGHRVAMLRRAVRPHRHLSVLELEDVSFSVATTFPRLLQRFDGHQLIFLMGSDTVQQLPEWPHYKQLLRRVELLIGLRDNDTTLTVKQLIADWPMQPRVLTVINSYAAQVSSNTVREALRRRQYIPGLLRSVECYSNQNWLYVSLRNT